MAKPVKFDFDNYDEAMTEFANAKAIIETVSEVVHEHGEHLSGALFAAQRCIERGLNDLDMGRWR